jgi:glycine/D-amino acid oxidase-like deaminating enzyme
LGQIMDPIDYSGFIGRNPGNKNVYVATGDSGQGITHGVVASLLISDLITKGSSDRARSFASKMHLLHRQRYVLFGGVRTGF